MLRLSFWQTRNSIVRGKSGSVESLRVITYAHDLVIILASIVVSPVAAFSGSALTSKIGSLPVSKRKALIVVSAFVLGGGICCMHFIDMKGMRGVIPIFSS